MDDRFVHSGGRYISSTVRLGAIVIATRRRLREGNRDGKSKDGGESKRAGRGKQQWVARIVLCNRPNFHLEVLDRVRKWTLFQSDVPIREIAVIRYRIKCRGAASFDIIMN